MATRSKLAIVLGALFALVAALAGAAAAQTMAAEFGRPATWTFFLPLVAGTAVAVLLVVQVQRLNPISLESWSDALAPARLRRGASVLFRCAGWMMLAMAVGAFGVWLLSPAPNWSWQLFCGLGLGLLLGSAANDWLERSDDAG